jgi:hypothetical protein
MGAAMKATFLQEPELEFGQGKHIDIRFGIANYKPLDYLDQLAPKNIPLGVVGTEKTISEFRAWIESCATGIHAKVSDQPNLFPAFPGFGPESPFDSTLVFDSRLERQVSSRNLPKTVNRKDYNAFLKDLADAYIAEADAASDKGASVIVCALPMEVLDLIDPDDPAPEDAEQDADGSLEQDFHDLLKARAMSVQKIKPIQLVLPTTYSENVKRRQRKKNKVRKLQDPATRAWNFHTALYYKAGGAPWRLIRDEAHFKCCYVGVSFYKTLDGSEVYTSSAQVFNERGEGVIVRGGPAKMTKDDRNVHINNDGAYALLRDALVTYKGEHKNMPARVVIHKTSSFDDEEIDGFTKAIKERDIELYDMVYISKSNLKLYRAGRYPPLRGTSLQIDEDTTLLYTRGGVDFFQTYPGMYVPRALEVCAEDTDRSLHDLAAEVLSLTKMNWNNTEFDNSMPITIQAAKRVGRILKYLGKDDKANALYSYYM